MTRQAGAACPLLGVFKGLNAASWRLWRDSAMFTFRYGKTTVLVGSGCSRWLPSRVLGPETGRPF